MNPYADPRSTYSVMCYMLYNGTEEDGDEAPVGWVRDYLYDHESRAFGGDEKAIADFLSQYGGQRFLPTAFGKETDPPINDLTVANGYNGLAAYAFTVDRDFSAETAEDRELYVQFYNFKDHKTYVPVKVAGEIELYDINIPDRHKSGYEIYETTEAVEVAQPKLIRSGGSTWLFWREDQDGLRYLNISELLNAKVSDDDYSDYEGRSEKEIGEIAASNVRYALRDDGTLDPAYTLNVPKVDFGSYTTNGDLNVTDYQIITDADDNLYVVWTDTTLDRVYSEALDEYVEKTSVEIYAAARIREAELAERNGEGTTQPVRWSKPYRLTRDSMYHDGVSITLADDGGLIIVHNQYDMLLADTQEEQEKMVLEGRAGWKEVDGETYLVGSPYYPSESDLMITRCAPVGSLEATTFEYSDSSPMPGDEITVKAVVENTGLTAACGCDIDFYAVKDGLKVGGQLVFDVSFDPLPESEAGFELILTCGADRFEPAVIPLSYVPESAGPDPAEGGCSRGASCILRRFSDLDPAAWYHDGIHAALERGTMNGYADGMFRPDSPTSRAMLVTMPWRMEGMPQVRYDLRFADVPEGAWFAEAVRWAVSAGIVSGYDASSFGPDDGVTREQLAAILYRYASPRRETASSGEEDLRDSFGDAAQISPWALDAMG